MGLDNGIIVHGLKLKEVPAYIATKISDFDFQIKYYSDMDEVEICYWRKCWNIRGTIGDILETYIDNVTADDYNFKIDKDILKEIKSKLSIMLSQGEEHWEDRSPSIWTFEEFKPFLENQIIVIDWFLRFMEDNPNRNFEIEFYDSY